MHLEFICASGKKYPFQHVIQLNHRGAHTYEVLHRNLSPKYNEPSLLKTRIVEVREVKVISSL